MVTVRSRLARIRTPGRTLRWVALAVQLLFVATVALLYWRPFGSRA
jgi:hypothetical protein